MLRQYMLKRGQISEKLAREMEASEFRSILGDQEKAIEARRWKNLSASNRPGGKVAALSNYEDPNQAFTTLGLLGDLRGPKSAKRRITQKPAISTKFAKDLDVLRKVQNFMDGNGPSF
eukprot:TRINITY_DN819_c0_g2_i2.p1 TRINITY_DN819_c0_g2~~TRINITY_DN819_c0_g2_i2.p1  ORF type:complete len:118 (+),score=19.47 TRINITY_DN819_c0_g2_i2:249-602(+)